MNSYVPYDKTTEVSIGTAAEIPEEEVRKKPIHIQDQVVKDERGRRRFHGAFTGGFSAGYFNTVGTEEGWTPKSFTSSRSNRSSGQDGSRTNKYHQSIEDFMDEEDKSEVGFAPKRVSATNQFEAKTAQAAPVIESGALSGAVLADLVVPAEVDMGSRLMKLMGWREGQGVGPRTEASVKRLQNDNPHAREEDLKEELRISAGKTFAPKDVSIDSFEPKDDLHGIGYRGMSASDFNLGHPQPKRKGAGGFGVGALEEDDPDIYDEDDMESYDRVAGPANTADQQGPRHLFRPKSSRYQSDASMISDHLAGSDIPLRGFVLSKSTFSSIKVYPPPKIPKDFNPFHVFKTAGPAFEQHNTAGGPAAGKPSNLTAKERMLILGEEEIAPKKSVFDYLKPEDKARLLNKGMPPPGPPPRLPPGAPSRGPPPPPPLGWKASSEQIRAPVRPIQAPRPPPGMNSKTAMMPGVFRPFEKDPAKERRYLAYLDGNSIDNGHMHVEEQVAELEAFVKAALLYQPMQGAMASRFTTASDIPAENAGKTKSEGKRPASQEQESAKDNAVKLKLFGSLTRETFEWHPVSLLCKRFDVPDPFPKSGVVGVIVGARPGALEKFQNMQPAENSVIKPNEHWNDAVAAQLEADHVADEAEQEEQAVNRPSMDIFKAIFSDSSSDEEDDAAGPRGVDLPAHAPVLPPPYDPTKVNRNPDSSASKKESVDTYPIQTEIRKEPEIQPPEHVPAATSQPLKLSLVHTYRNLTPKAPASTMDTSSAASSSASMWIEKPTVAKTHKSKKDKKKNKKKSKKHKKEKGSKKERQSRASDTDDSDDDDRTPSDLELLSKMRSARGAVYAQPAGPSKPPPSRSTNQRQAPNQDSRLKHDRIGEAIRASHDSSSSQPSRRKRPTAADFM